MKPLPALAWFALALAIPVTSNAQPAGAREVRHSLNWEGQTGGVATPFAYVSASPDNAVGRPAISFAALPAGDNLGNRLQLGATAGFFGRVEVGYMKSAVFGISTDGASPLANLFDRGFQTIHVKAVLLAEDAGESPVPAIAAGGQFRWQVNLLDDTLGEKTLDGDVYVVATKTFGSLDDLPIVLNGGVRVTNAALFGMAGNAPDWSARAFGAAGVVLGDRVLAGAEFAQQPAEVVGVPGVEMPATVSFFARLLPRPGRSVAITVAFVRLAGEIAAGIDVEADKRVLVGVTAHF